MRSNKHIFRSCKSTLRWVQYLFEMNVKKGILVTAVPFLFFGAENGLAKSKKMVALEVTANFTKATQEAEALLAKKKRNEALTILREAEGLNLQIEQRAQLAAIKKLVSQAFLAEKSQQSYEVAISLRTKDLQQELSKLQEASLVDGSNFLIRLEMGRVLLAQGKCNEGLSLAEEMLKQNSEDGHAKLLADQAHFCNGNPFKFLKAEQLGKDEDPDLRWSWQFLWIEATLKNKAYGLAESTFLTIDDKVKTRYPDADFFEMAIKIGRGSKESVWIDTYRNKCASFSLVEGRRWLLDPNLCWRKPESLLNLSP